MRIIGLILILCFRLILSCPILSRPLPWQRRMISIVKPAFESKISGIVTRIMSSYYLEALREEANHTDRVKFFFPSHTGGKYAPQSLKDLMMTSLAYDLPELDGLDNFHSPEVVII